ncbi:MAG: hypothetical protein ACQESP_05400 [Candidatus Muiribacteriota bacterium]
MVDKINDRNIMLYENLLNNNSQPVNNNSFVNDIAEKNQNNISQLEDNLDLRGDQTQEIISDYNNQISNLENEYTAYENIASSLENIRNLQQEFQEDENTEERTADFQEQIDEEIDVINNIIEQSPEEDINIFAGTNLIEVLNKGISVEEENPALEAAENDMYFRMDSVESRIQSNDRRLARNEEDLVNIENAIEEIEDIDFRDNIIDEINNQITSNEVNADNLNSFYNTNNFRDILLYDIV